MPCNKGLRLRRAIGKTQIVLAAIYKTVQFLTRATLNGIFIICTFMENVQFQQYSLELLKAWTFRNIIKYNFLGKCKNSKFTFFFFFIVPQASTQGRKPATRSMGSQHLWTFERIC